MNERKSVQIRVYGRVQGVGFRYYTHKKAQELDVKGYVRNRPDGTVYIEAEASSDQLERFILWCESGPSWARVSRIEHQFVSLIGYDSFVVR